MNLKIFLFTHVSALLLISPALRAVSLGDLAMRADAIVKGSVDTRLEGVDEVSFSIKIEKVIKGDPALERADIDHHWRGLAVNGSSEKINAVLHGIWFLKKTNSQSWDLIEVSGRSGFISNLFWPSGAANSSSSLLPSSAPTVGDTLVIETAGAVTDGLIAPQDCAGRVTRRGCRTFCVRSVFRE